MTPEQSQAIKARRAAITPGPWATITQFVGERGEYNGGVVVLGAYTNGHNPTVAICANAANAEFIATAPTYIDALLDEVERLTAELAQTQHDKETLMLIATTGKPYRSAYPN